MGMMNSFQDIAIVHCRVGTGPVYRYRSRRYTGPVRYNFHTGRYRPVYHRYRFRKLFIFSRCFSHKDPQTPVTGCAESTQGGPENNFRIWKQYGCELVWRFLYFENSASLLFSLRSLSFYWTFCLSEEAWSPFRKFWDSVLITIYETS